MREQRPRLISRQFSVQACIGVSHPSSSLSLSLTPSLVFSLPLSSTVFLSLSLSPSLVFSLSISCILSLSHPQSPSLALSLSPPSPPPHRGINDQWSLKRSRDEAGSSACIQGVSFLWVLQWLSLFLILNNPNMTLPNGEVFVCKKMQMQKRLNMITSNILLLLLS